MMQIIKILQKRSRYFYLLLIVVSLINAAWSNALLLFINSKISGTTIPVLGNYTFLVFLVMIGVSYFVSRFFQIYMMKLTMDLSYEMGMTIFKKVRYSAYEAFSKYGKEKVYSLLGDTQTVSNFPGSFIELINSLIMFIVGLGYLFTISAVGAATVLGLLIGLAIVYFYQTVVAEKYLAQTRELADVYHKNINDLLHGFKESKMNSIKADNLLQRLDQNRLKVKVLNLKTAIKWLNNDLLGRYFWFVMIGVVLFVLPYVYAADPEVIAGFIVTLLFLIAPVGSLIGMIPTYAGTKLAIQKLQQFDLKVDFSDMYAADKKDVIGFQFDESFRQLQFQDIVYNYTTEDNKKSFTVTVDDLSINKGELVFITGGNGSGKTTFVNTLIGLFLPAEGKMFYNDHAVTKENCSFYRNKLATIFADHYLFSENYDNYVVNDQNEELLNYIRLMKLENIVKIHNEKNKLELELSKGQQKRLSMIYALMEDKEILVLDEWAADQDPNFRAYFYGSFLQELKRMGKTIIMVTHDDYYYRHGDRIIKFDFGRIISDTHSKQIINEPDYEKQVYP